MFKNIKKIVLVLVFVAVMFFVVSCTQEQKDWTKEQCIEQFGFEECVDWTKDQCTEKYPCPEAPEWTEAQCKEKYPCAECPKCPECPECPDWTEAQCKEKYPTVCPEPEDPTKAQCEELYGKYEEQKFAIPTAFEIYGDIIEIGQEFETEVEALEPENAISAFIWESSDPTIATVSQTGVVTGVRPGTVVITATSVYDDQVYFDADFDVKDPVLDQIELVAREKAAILAAMPQYTDSSFAFPKPWNANVVVTYKDPNGVAVEEFELPEELTADVELIYTAEIVYKDASDSATIKIGAVKDLAVNDFARVNTAATAAEAILKQYLLGELVSTDLILPETIFGVPLGWSSDNTAVLSSDGKYVRPLDNKSITYTVTPKFGVTSKSSTFTVVAKGYDADEKVAYILNEGSLSTLAETYVEETVEEEVVLKPVYKAFNTSLVFPKQDAMFGVDLSYVSGNPAIFDNDGNLVAAPAEATNVEFTVTANYNRSGVAANNFEGKEFKFTVTALPATAASAAAEAFAAEFKLDSELWFPYGEVNREGGNTLQVPTKYTHNEVEYAVEYVVDDNFKLVEGVPTLVTQFFRYHESRMTVKLTAGEDSASFEALLNVGISNKFDVAYLSWRNSEQKDASLTPESGLYDVTNEISYFDKYVGNTSYKNQQQWSTWSGYTLTAEKDGVVYKELVLEAMVVYIRKDADGNIYYDNKHYAGSYINQTNWGHFFVNLTGEDVKVAVGTYASGNDALGLAIAEYGNRDNLTYDGYALGFVADKDGKILVGSEETKFQNYINCSNQLAQFTKTGQTSTSDMFMKDVTEFNPIYAKDEDGNLTETITGYAPVNAADVDTYYAPYATIPAEGYGMSWKYQFYGVGTPVVKYPFTRANTTIAIEKYDKHPLNSIDCKLGKEYFDTIKNAAENDATSKTLDKNIVTGLYYYDSLENDEQRAYVGNKEELLAAYVAAWDREIDRVLALSAEEDYLLTLATLGDRYDALDAVVKNALTKGATLADEVNQKLRTFVVTYEADGGEFYDYYKASQKSEVIAAFLSDFYDFFVEKNLLDKLPESIRAKEDFTNSSKFQGIKVKVSDLTTAAGTFDVTPLSTYLYEPYMKDGVANENYRAIDDTSLIFVKQTKYAKWQTLIDFVNEGVMYANFAGQDVWGRKGLALGTVNYCDPEASYNGTKLVDLVSTTQGNELGCTRFLQWMAGSVVTKPTIYKNADGAALKFTESVPDGIFKYEIKPDTVASVPSQKAEVVAAFLSDFYDFFVEKNLLDKLPEGLRTKENFTNPSKFQGIKVKVSDLTAAAGTFDDTPLSTYLFEPYMKDGVANENHRAIDDNSLIFVNQTKYAKWQELIDFVNEGVMYVNFGGQDVWGRKGLALGTVKYCDPEASYNGVKLVELASTNQGSQLGATRFLQWMAGSVVTNPTTYKDADGNSIKFSDCVPAGLVEIDLPYTSNYTIKQETVELSSLIEKDGFKFEGWFMDPEFTVPAAITGSLAKNVTVYAKWSTAE